MFDNISLITFLSLIGIAFGGIIAISGQIHAHFDGSASLSPLSFFVSPDIVKQHLAIMKQKHSEGNTITFIGMAILVLSGITCILSLYLTQPIIK